MQNIIFDDLFPNKSLPTTLLANGGGDVDNALKEPEVAPKMENEESEKVETLVSNEAHTNPFVALTDLNSEENKTMAVIHGLNPHLPEERQRLILWLLAGNDQKAKGQFNAAFGTFVIRPYDWAVMVIMILVGFFNDYIASSNSSNTSATAEFDFVYTRLAGCIVAMITMLDHWYKNPSAPYSAIGVSVQIILCLDTLKLAYDGRSNLALPNWSFAFFMLVMLLLPPKYVSNKSAAILLLNLTINCVILNVWYLPPMMLLLLLVIRNGGKIGKMVDRFMRTWWNFGLNHFLVALMAVVFGCVLFSKMPKEMEDSLMKIWNKFFTHGSNNNNDPINIVTDTD